jgi:hypothetical protein
MIDTRKYGRELRNIPIRIGDIECETFNLSLGGAKCYCDNPVLTLRELPICLTLPDGILNFKGVVLRCEETIKDRFELGIFFKNISMTDDDRNKLGSYLGYIF